MSYIKHAGIFQPNVIGAYNTHVIGINPLSFGYGNTARDEKSFTTGPSGAIQTREDIKRSEKRLTRAIRQQAKEEAENQPKIDVATQQQFEKDLTSWFVGRKKAPAKITDKSEKTDVPSVDAPKGGKKRVHMVSLMSKGGQAKGGQAKGGQAKGGAVVGGGSKTWIQALKLWNEKHNKGSYTIPKKGTKEYDAVRALMK